MKKYLVMVKKHNDEYTWTALRENGVIYEAACKGDAKAKVLLQNRRFPSATYSIMKIKENK